MSNDRARTMRIDMLRSLAKVRDAYRTYLRIWEEYRERVRVQYGYSDDALLLPEHEKLAEQNADRDPFSISAATTIRTHQPLALTFGVAYLVEVDHAWRFDSIDVGEDTR